ncbi:MAG: hypothetical protein H6604_07350 [Flavobacteriales bacterium]|nr:hypothetical protein [Flavobacteriales bacterium]
MINKVLILFSSIVIFVSCSKKESKENKIIEKTSIKIKLDSLGTISINDKITSLDDINSVLNITYKNDSFYSTNYDLYIHPSCKIGKLEDFRRKISEDSILSKKHAYYKKYNLK